MGAPVYQPTFPSNVDTATDMSGDWRADRNDRAKIDAQILALQKFLLSLTPVALADANTTLDQSAFAAGGVAFSGPLTATRSITIPVSLGVPLRRALVNNTGQSLAFTTSQGTGTFAVAAGAGAEFLFDGATLVAIGSGGSGGSPTYGTDVQAIDALNQRVRGIQTTQVAAGTPADGASLVKQSGGGYVTSQLVPNLDVAFSVAADGTTDDRAHLANADAAAGPNGMLTCTRGPIKIGSNITFASRVAGQKPARLVPANGVVVTFTNGIDVADDHYFLDVSQGGSFVFQDAARFRGAHTYRPNDEVHASWFGVKCDPTNTTTCDAPALQAAINSLPEGGTLVLPNGTITTGTTSYTYPIIIGGGYAKSAGITIRGSAGTNITPNNGFQSIIARTSNYYALAPYTMVGGATVRGLLFGTGFPNGPMMRLTDFNGLSGTLNGASKFSFRQKWVPRAAGAYPVNASFGNLRYNGGTAQTGAGSIAFIQSGSATTCTFAWGDDTFANRTITINVPGGGWQAGHEYEITAEFDGTQSTPGATLFCTVFDATAGTCAMATSTTAGVTHTIGESFYNEFTIGGRANTCPVGGDAIEKSGFGALLSVQYTSGTNNNITPSGTAAQIASASLTTPIVITTTAASGLATGDWLVIPAGSYGITGLNGTWMVSVSGANVTLLGSAGTGSAYTANSASISQAFRPVVGQYQASGTNWSSSTYSFMCNFGSGYSPPDNMMFSPKPSTPVNVLTATSANPAVITCASSVGVTGDTVTIPSSSGNAAIIGTWPISVSGGNITLVGCDAHLAGAYVANSATVANTNTYVATVDCYVKKSSTPFVSMLLRPWGGFTGFPCGQGFSVDTVQMVAQEFFVIAEGFAQINAIYPASITIDACQNFLVTGSSASAPAKALAGVYAVSANGKFVNCALAGGGAITVAFNDSTILCENCYWQPTTAYTKYSLLCLGTGFTASYDFKQCTIDGEFYGANMLAGVLVSGGTVHFDYAGDDNIIRTACPFFLFSMQPGTIADTFSVRGSYKPLFGANMIEIDQGNNPPMSNYVATDITLAVGAGSGPISLTNDTRYVRTHAGDQSPYYWQPLASSTNDLQLGAASDVVALPYGGADRTLTGIVIPPIQGNHTAPTNRLRLTNRDATYNLLIPHRSSSSAVGNRIRTVDGSTYTLAPGKSIALRRTESGSEWLGARTYAVGRTKMGFDANGVVQGVFVVTAITTGITGSKSLSVTWSGALSTAGYLIVTSTAHGLSNGDLALMPAPVLAGPYPIVVIDANNFYLTGAPTYSAGSGTAQVIRTTAGTTGVVPAWNTTTPGVSTTTDNGVTWTYVGPAEWEIVSTSDALIGVGTTDDFGTGSIVSVYGTQVTVGAGTKYPTRSVKRGVTLTTNASYGAAFTYTPPVNSSANWSIKGSLSVYDGSNHTTGDFYEFSLEFMSNVSNAGVITLTHQGGSVAPLVGPGNLALTASNVTSSISGTVGANMNGILARARVASGQIIVEFQGLAATTLNGEIALQHGERLP